MSAPGSPRAGRWRASWIAATLCAMFLVSMSPAYAGFGGGSEAGTNPPPQSTNPGSPPSTGGGGIGGGVPVWKYWQFNSLAVSPGISQAGCAAQRADGSLFIAVKYRYRYPADMGLTGVQNLIRAGTFADHGIERLSSQCLYDGAWREETVRCVISSTAIARMVVPRSVTLATRTTQSAYSENRGSVDACRSSRTQAYVEVTPAEYGHYRIDASSRVLNAVIRTQTEPNGLTGQLEPPRIVSTSAEFTTAAFQADGTLTCSGWRDGKPDRTYTWTANDCPFTPENPSGFQCLVGGSPTVEWNGQRFPAREVQILRDGSDVWVQWDTPTIAGSGLKQIVSTRSRMAVQGAPWSNQKTLSENFFGLQRESQRQSALTGADGTAWKSGLTTQWSAQWYQATDSPTTLTPQYGFTADYTKSSVRILGLDEAGRWIVQPVTVTVRADAACSGQPVSVSTLRVVNF